MSKRMVLVSSDGAIQPLKTGCSETLVDETVTLPGVQPSYLHIETGDGALAPCNYPFGGPTFGSYVLDDLVFGT